jgi:hypothetical protein
VIRNSAEVTKGEMLHIRPLKGNIQALVEKVENY